VTEQSGSVAELRGQRVIHEVDIELTLDVEHWTVRRG